MTIEELKQVKILVVDKYNRDLSPTNALIAKTLIAREKAEWVIDGKKLRLLRTKRDWKELKKKVIDEEGRICYICSKKIPNDVPATIDHVNPKSKLGKDDRSNLKCCCKECNDDKADRNLNQYITYMKNNIDKYSNIDFEKLKETANEIRTVTQPHGIQHKRCNSSARRLRKGNS